MLLLLFILGGVLLVGGAELLVRGASRLAMAAGISPLVVGLTVVALGTSSPEMAVTLGAALSSEADVAVGNLIGSNISNVLLILGLSAAVAPLVVSVRLIRLEVPLMIGVSTLVCVLALDGTISRVEGAVLFALLVLYLTFVVRRSRSEATPREHRLPGSPGTGSGGTAPGWLPNGLSVAAGLVLLVVGSRWLVEGAVAAATALGVSSLVIGLTVVAVGTSLPELATSVVAAVRGERDIAVGNVVGSNLFNLLAVLGVGALVSPGGIPVAGAALSFDLPVMLAVAVACLPIFFTGHAIARWEGWLFLGYYGAYTLYLFLAAAEHDALPLLDSTMVLFVLPVTLVTLTVLAIQAVRRQGGRRS